MKLELATVVSCSETDCIVRTIHTELQTKARYSDKVRNRIRIEPGHLVVIDETTDQPVVMWRWVPVTVERIEGDRIIVSGDIRKLVSVAKVRDLGLDLAPGDQAWVCGMPDGKELHDKIVDGKPESPRRLLKHIQPTIEEIYLQTEDL